MYSLVLEPMREKRTGLGYNQCLLNNIIVSTDILEVYVWMRQYCYNFKIIGVVTRVKEKRVHVFVVEL